MNKVLELYDQVQKKAGVENVNKLILNERAANQRYWSQKLEMALQDKLNLASSVKSVISEMRTQAERYEQ